MNGSIHNFYHCLASHPAIVRLVNSQLPIRILIGSDSIHANVGSNIAQRCPPWMNARVEHVSLDHAARDALREGIITCDLYVLLYSESRSALASPSDSALLADLSETLTVYWRKSALFKNYGEHLYEAFAEPIEQISQRNKKLISAAQLADFVSYTDAHGGALIGMLTPQQCWTSVEGCGNEDIVPGEVSTRLHNLRGRIQFSGSFLSDEPFACKYGVVDEFMTLFLKSGKLMEFDCPNDAFTEDFEAYLDAHPGNRIVEEFAIGTNTGIHCLYGLNAGFEARHPGVHLRLGGGTPDSQPLYLLFSGGQICFDRRVVYDDGFWI